MSVISVPIRLRISASALFLSIPLAMVEVILIKRAPWWNLPYKNMGYTALICALICIPLVISLAAAKKWAYAATSIALGIWLLVSLVFCLKIRHPSMGFFTLFLVAFVSSLLVWLNHEICRSFIDPQVAWYQGQPKPIPGLQCHLSSGEKITEFKVGRIDKDGVFIFSAHPGGKQSTTLSSFLDRKKLEIAFQFRDTHIRCQGIPTSSFWGETGAGIRFFGLSADLKKEIGDLLETLRGEGYL